MEQSGTFHAPALLTGTSSEFLGRRPLPRLIRNRHVVFVLGPQGVGKSVVARKLAGEAHLSIDAHQLEHAMLDRVRHGAWKNGLNPPEPLVIDGPVWLRNRPGVVAMLAELALSRSELGRRTVFCQVELDGSIEQLIAAMKAGSAVVVGLRFPTGRRARLRCARSICEDLGLPPTTAGGSASLEPWRYDRLVAWLVERAWRD